MYKRQDHHHADEVFTSWGMQTPASYTQDEISGILEELEDEKKYGFVLRAKGMVPAGDETWVYFDYVPGESNVREGKPDVTGKFCVIGSEPVSYTHLSATHTLRMWASVRRGEEENIFPFQESADAMFNSALLYELAVLKQFAEPLLYSVGKDEPEYFEAKRLLKFLEYFLGVSSENLPNNSIVREFVGGSCFRCLLYTSRCV